ncbi:MAG: hypothetical protein U0Q03_13695 [Acidimicrobiales bacterium]
MSTQTRHTRTTNHTSDHMPDWQDRWFELMKRIEMPMVRTTARVAGRMADYLPERPARMAGMPKVHDLMDAGLTFRRRLVDEQTEFADSMMRAMRPVIVKVDTVHHDDHHLTMPKAPTAPKAATTATTATASKPKVARRNGTKPVARRRPRPMPTTEVVSGPTV